MLSAFYCLFDKGSKKRVNKKCYEKKSMLLFFKVLFYSQRVGYLHGAAIKYE